MASTPSDESAVRPPTGADTRVIRAKFGREPFVRTSEGKAELVWPLDPPRVLLAAAVLYALSGPVLWAWRRGRPG